MVSCDERTRIIDDAINVREGHKELGEITNPKEFDEPVRQALAKNKAAELLLERFEILDFVYDELFPDEKTLPEAGRPIAEETIGKSVRTDLKIYIAIPKTLFKSKRRTILKLVLRFHGGGGVSRVECNLLEHQLTL
jgi:sulfur relay (sulfurtransferase) DsrC/TusE family protein